MNTILDKPFNAAQIELMQLLANNLDSNELVELRQLLISFRFRLVEERAERIAKNKGWSEEQINQMSQEHLRVSVNKKPNSISENSKG